MSKELSLDFLDSSANMFSYKNPLMFTLDVTSSFLLFFKNWSHEREDVRWFLFS